MGFQTEEELVREFIVFATRSMPTGWKWTKEFDGGLGVADIVFIKQATQSQHARKQLREIPARLAALYSQDMSQKNLSSEEFRSLLGTSHTQTMRVINLLKKLKTITQNKDKTLKIKTVTKPPFSPIISIEAKLGDWRRALIQACRYTQFSHESWVLLDAAKETSAKKNIELFQRTGIGLASFSKDGNLFVHHKAEHREPTSREKFWRAQAVLAKSASFIEPSSSRH